MIQLNPQPPFDQQTTKAYKLTFEEKLEIMTLASKVGADIGQ